MKIEAVQLGDREYKLGELPLRKAKAYRERLREPFGSLIDLFERTPNTDITNTAQVAQMVRSLSSTLLDSVDTVAELLLEYADVLGNDRDYILDNAYGSQVVDAFIAVLGLVFPFFGTERGSKLTKAMAAIGSNSAQT